MRLRDYSKTDRVLVGRGFEWRYPHVEALMRFEKKHALPHIDEVRGTPCLHAVGADTQSALFISCDPKDGHVGVEGTTRSGKSVMLTLMAVQEIHRNRGAVVFVDPKSDPDAISHILVAAHRARRRLAIFAPLFYDAKVNGKPLSCNIDPLSTCGRFPESVVARLDPLFGPQKNDFFKNNALQNILLMARVHQAIGRRWTLNDLHRDIMFPDRRAQACAQYLASLGLTVRAPQGTKLAPQHVVAAYNKSMLEDDLARQCVKLLSMSEEDFDKRMGDMHTAFMGLIGTGMARLLYDQPALTWAEIDSEQMVVLVLSTFMSLGSIGNAMSRLLLQDLMGYCGVRQSVSSAPVHLPINLFVDEVGMISYPELAAQAALIAGSNGRLVTAYQTRASVVGAMGSEERAEEFFGNLDTKIYFRLPDKGATDASKRFGLCDVPRLLSTATRESGGDGDRGNNVGRIERPKETPLVSPSWFEMLPNGHFFLRQSGRTMKCQGPLLPPADLDIVRRLGLDQLIHELRKQKELQHEQ